jgi:hypothetical protein
MWSKTSAGSNYTLLAEFNEDIADPNEFGRSFIDVNLSEPYKANQNAPQNVDVFRPQHPLLRDMVFNCVCLWSVGKRRDWAPGSLTHAEMQQCCNL